MAKKKPKSSGRDADWAEAKRRCRLSQEEIRMAKDLGISPRSLIKNIPSPSQPWKAPVKDWVRELYRKNKRRLPGRIRAAMPSWIVINSGRLTRSRLLPADTIGLMPQTVSRIR